MTLDKLKIMRLKNIAPLGDPISIELRGYELAIRKADSRFISVEVIFK